MRRLSAACILAGAILAVPAAVPAFAGGGVVCRSTLGARAIDGNVRVPVGTTCVLNRTRVDAINVASNVVLHRPWHPLHQRGERHGRVRVAQPTGGHQQSGDTGPPVLRADRAP